MKTPASRLAGIVLGVVIAGCATQSGFISGKKDPAMESALNRGRFDLSCPSATGNVISSNYIAAAESGEWKGRERAEFVIGVVGCDKRAAYVVACPEKSDTCQPAQPSALPGQPAAAPAPASAPQPAAK